ncbi:hypothetical protein Pcinc_019176 [Petrolisthes cinctipes]|uniref:Uncharacterized protein n=1 Tax=Petrolisthes cinctipes TaxID=88211 RepID=A0AAE1FKT6_PETCI|nr:hypothetical protein Pcinc_019176 [Petrolisthes cinctipes]
MTASLICSDCFQTPRPPRVPLKPPDQTLCTAAHNNITSFNNNISLHNSRISSRKHYSGLNARPESQQPGPTNPSPDQRDPLPLPPNRPTLLEGVAYESWRCGVWRRES